MNARNLVEAMTHVDWARQVVARAKTGEKFYVDVPCYAGSFEVVGDQKLRGMLKELNIPHYRQCRAIEKLEKPMIMTLARDTLAGVPPLGVPVGRWSPTHVSRVFINQENPRFGPWVAYDAKLDDVLWNVMYDHKYNNGAGRYRPANEMDLVPLERLLKHCSPQGVKMRWKRNQMWIRPASELGLLLQKYSTKRREQ